MKKNEDIVSKLEKYSDNAILRSIVNLIPYVGGSIDALITTRAQEITQKRLKSYFENLKIIFEKANASKIDYDFLSSEEFYDLILQTSHSISKTRSEDKIVLYANILKDTVTREFKDPLTPEDLVNIIDDLSLNDISFIKILSRYFSHPEVTKRHGYYLISSTEIHKFSPEYSTGIIWTGILRLERFNLIVRNTSIGTTKIENYAYSETPFLMAIIHYLTKNE